MYANMGGPVDSCTLDVRLRKYKRQFTRPWEAFSHNWNIRIHFVRLYISENWVQRGENSCVRKYGRSRSALYIKFTILNTLTPVHQAMASTLAQTAFSYTRCTYSS